MNIKIYFTNLWSKCDFSKLWIVPFFKQELGLDVEQSSLNSCDIVLCSVFGNNLEKNLLKQVLDKKNKKTFLISLENFERFQWIKPYIDKFNLATGLNSLNYKNYQRIPYYVWSKYEYYYLDIMRHHKLKNVSLIANNAQALRFKIINSLKNIGITTDCFGKISDRKCGDGTYLSKINTLSEYYFNICPENSHAPGYVTEKIHHALYANCIPIYWGDIELDRNFYNVNKILLIKKDFSNLDIVIEQCKTLLYNKSYLEDMVQMDSFAANKEDLINDEINSLKYKIQNTLL